MAISGRVLKLSGIALGVMVSATVFVGAGDVASADDGGLRQFFSEQFGVNFGASEQRPVYDEEPEDRPLVVRPHRRPISRKPRTAVAVGPVAPVSIYEDKTLQPGDAVMTAKGVRVFLGGRSMPYNEADFVAVSESEGLPRGVQKALMAIDKAPRT